MLAIERATLTRLLADVRQAITSRTGHDALVSTAHAIEHSFSRSIAQARAAARHQSLLSLADEVPSVASFLRPSKSASVDAALAARSAKSAATQFLSLGLENDGDQKDAARLFKPKVERFAATEVAQAFNAERIAVTDMAAEDIDNEGQPIPRKIWLAEIDSSLCPDCDDHEGEMVPWGANFKDDDEPGMIHSNCRCIEASVAGEEAGEGID